MVALGRGPEGLREEGAGVGSMEEKKKVVDQSERLPCPWCGKVEGLELILDNLPGTPEHRRWLIGCKNCDVSGQPASTPQAAERLWDARAPIAKYEALRTAAKAMRDAQKIPMSHRVNWKERLQLEQELDALLGEA